MGTARLPHDQPENSLAGAAPIRKLPAFSPVAVKLMLLVADEDVSFKEVAKLFSLDPVLAGQILKLANSGLYGRQVAIQSVLQAVAMLGLKSISRIAITAALTSGFPRPISPWVRDWWRHSIASALIADRAGQGNLSADFGYTAGLLHAVGLLALFRYAPEEYPKLLDPSRTTPAEAILRMGARTLWGGPGGALPLDSGGVGSARQPANGNLPASRP